MFNFTTTTIVNSVDGLFKGDLDSRLYVKNVGSFTSDEIVNTYKKEAAAEDVDTVTLATASATETGDIYRVAIDIELYKSESSLYARPWPTKGKPVYIEAIKGSGDFVDTLVANATKYMNLVYDKEILEVSKSGTNLVIKGVEGTQVLKNVVLEHWVANADTYAGGSWVEVAVGTSDKKANPGFGTYQHLIHNIVLPTYENMRYGSPVANAPKLGSMYNQYIITKRAERDAYGTGAVGQTLVSETQHVFWVESSIASDFEEAFGMSEEDDDVSETILND